ncbi:MAG: hypothetical protein AB7E52_04100 [Bdellovibrionales bacterium]
MTDGVTILTDFATNRADLVKIASLFVTDPVVVEKVEPKSLFSAVVEADDKALMEQALLHGAHIEPASDDSSGFVVVGKDRDHLSGFFEKMGLKGVEMYSDGGNNIVEITVPRQELSKEIAAMRSGCRIGWFPLATAG